ncbi:MAG: ATP-binding protein [Myxococcota bacterium]
MLVGPNNSGKSTCVEALGAGLGIADGSIGAVAELLLRRGGSTHHALKVTAHTARRGSPYRFEIALRTSTDTIHASMETNDIQEPAVLHRAINQGLSSPLVRVCTQASLGDAVSVRAEAMFDEQGRHTVSKVVTSDQPESEPLAWDFIDVDAVRASRALEDAYSAIEQAGSLPVVVDALRASMPSLRDLRILKIEDEFILHLFIDEGPPIPAYLAGDGLKRLLAIAASISKAAGGVVLLEEPECFQHPRYLRELVRLLANAVKSNTQVIMTTHSSDLIDLLLHHEPSFEELVFQRLRLIDGELKATALRNDAARMLRDELLEDLRA